MARIHSDAIVIEVSRIDKDDQHLESIVNDEIVATLEQVVQQLVGEGAVVEVKAAG